MAEINSGRYLAETLKGLGVTHVFHVPHLFAMAHMELPKAGIVRVLAHHEIAATYMADGYARVSQRPGVLMAQGVGATNVLAGLREPYLAGSPVVALTGGPHPDSRYQYLYQVVDDLAAFDAVTKFNAVVEKPARFPDLLRQAFREATTSTPGPVHLELPGRVGQGAEGTGDWPVITEKQYSHVPPHRPMPDPTQVEAAVRLLSQAKRPVIIAGGGVITSGAGAELVQLAEKLNIPVATSPTGKGSIPENHRLVLGVVGSYGRRAVNQTVQEADLVFFAASRAGDLTTDHYLTPPKGVPSIQMDINPAELGRVYPVQVGLLGDAKVTLASMVTAANPGSDNAAWVKLAQDRVAIWRAQLKPKATSDASPIRPERLCREISQALPDNGVLVADTGHASIWTATIIELTKPTQRYIRCMGTLGWGLPGAIGAKCGAPDRPVVAFVGDGAFFYHMAELETAARAGINVVVVVNNNSAFSQEKGLIAMLGHENALGEPKEIYAFQKVNFSRVAEEMGCLGIRVEKAGEIKPALAKAFAANRPVVVEVITDIDAMPEWS